MSVVFDAIANTVQMAVGSPDMEKHVQGFVRTKRGSHIVGLDDLTSTLNFLYDISARCTEVSHDEVNADCPGAAREPARYFRFDIPEEYQGVESIVLLEDTAGEGLDSVRVREGAHGFELYTVTPEAFPEKAATQGWVIVGPSEAGLVVWTWYPGRMTAGSPLDKHAVKVNS